MTSLIEIENVCLDLKEMQQKLEKPEIWQNMAQIANKKTSRDAANSVSREANKIFSATSESNSPIKRILQQFTLNSKFFSAAFRIIQNFYFNLNFHDLLGRRAAKVDETFIRVCEFTTSEQKFLPFNFRINSELDRNGSDQLW